MIVRELLCWFLLLYMIVVMLAIVLSWFPLEPGGPGDKVFAWCWRVTDPVLRPIRSALPMVRVGGGAIDLSPTVLFLAIIIVRAILC